MSDLSSESDAVLAALERLRDEVVSTEIDAEIYTDESQMTPMLVVNFAGSGDRSDVLRPLFHADGPVKVDSVHSHRVVVRGDT